MADLVAKCKRILQAVDLYHEAPNSSNRTELRRVIHTELETAGMLAVKELENITRAKRYDRSVFDDDSAFADWVQSRAQHTLHKCDTAHGVHPCEAPSCDQWYLQDKRSYVGNDMLFWAAAGGYTTDVSKAQVFTREKAYSQHEQRDTDLPWPKAYIDSKTRPAVDMQYVKHAEALATYDVAPSIDHQLTVNKDAASGVAPSQGQRCNVVPALSASEWLRSHELSHEAGFRVDLSACQAANILRDLLGADGVKGPEHG